MNPADFAIMGWAEGFLFSVSSVLYLPVVLGLALLVFYMIYLVGSLVREQLDRKRGNYRVRHDLQDRLAELFSTTTRNLDVELERALQEIEREMHVSVEKSRFVVRAGPGVGLMGTLIPMGVALAALSQGSMPEMAQHMVRAFTSAVVGLGCGVLAFAIALVREQWVRADVAHLRYVTELALRDGIAALQRIDGPAAAPAGAAQGAL